MVNCKTCGAPTAEDDFFYCDPCFDAVMADDPMHRPIVLTEEGARLFKAMCEAPAEPNAYLVDLFRMVQ